MAINGNLAVKDMDYERICFLGFNYVINIWMTSFLVLNIENFPTH
jgi:hypothetical protein